MFHEKYQLNGWKWEGLIKVLFNKEEDSTTLLQSHLRIVCLSFTDLSPNSWSSHERVLRTVQEFIGELLKLLF